MRTANTSIDYTNKDYEAFRTAMIERLQLEMPEYTDTRRSDAGIMIIELLAMGLDIISFYQDVYANEVYLATAEQRENVMKWANMLGYTPRFSTPAKFTQVFKLVGEQTTDTVIPKGTVVQTDTSSGEEEVFYETQEDLVIPAGKLGDETDESGLYQYTVDVVEGTTIPQELMGSSDGTASQTFTTSYSPVIVDDSLQVFVRDSVSMKLWDRVDNFIDSKSGSMHYTVSLDDDGVATITFGDGNFGAIPAALRNNIFITYRIGGGTDGNVGANTITKMGTQIALVDSTFNPDNAYEDGQDAETLSEIKTNAPVYARTKFGALTLEDFAEIVKMHYPTILAVNTKRDSSNQDNIYIYILQSEDETLSDEMKQQILDMYDWNDGGKVVVGVNEVFVEPATFKAIDLSATLVVSDNYSKDLVKYNIETYLQNYFAIGNYDFAEELSLSMLAHEVFENVEGIKVFYFTSPSTETISAGDNEIITLNSLAISASGGV